MFGLGGVSGFCEWILFILDVSGPDGDATDVMNWMLTYS